MEIFLPIIAFHEYNYKTPTLSQMLSLGTELDIFIFLPYGADQKNQLYLCFTQCIKTDYMVCKMP